MSDPIYVVRFPGIHREDDFDRMCEWFMRVNGDALDGKVVFVDGMVGDIFKLGEQDGHALEMILADESDRLTTFEKTKGSLWPIGKCSKCGHLQMSPETARYCENCGRKVVGRLEVEC